MFNQIPRVCFNPLILSLINECNVFVSRTAPVVMISATEIAPVLSKPL